MISKLSAHLGPTSIFSGISAPPSLVLHLDAGNLLSYPPTGFTVSGGGTQHILNNWPSQPSEWNNYGPTFLQGGDFQDLGTPSAGWYIVDDNGDTFQVLSGPATGYSFSDTPVYNGQGWFFVMSGTFSISASNSTVNFYETQPTVTSIYGGSTWYDLTNLNNDISLLNTTFSPTYSQLSKFRGSFEFNGTNSGGALISGTAIPLMDSHYTIESWIQANDPYGLGGIIGWGNYALYQANVLRQYGTNFENYWYGSELITPATYSTDYWYHLAATYDGANRTIYLNGQSLGTDTPGVSHSVPYFNNLTVGVSNATEFFDGRIGMIKVWNKNLNSTQLLSAFNSNKSKYGYDFGSMVFNGSNSYLQTSSGGIYSDLCLGPFDFTVEAFFKSSTASNAYTGIISQRQQGSFNVSINLQNANTSEPLIEFTSGSIWTTFTASNNKWYHVAISRTGGTSSFFVNGNLINEVADTTNYDRHDFVVGRYYTDYNDYYFNGLISNARVINETGLYTSSFTPPSTPLSVTQSNTKLLISSQEINPSGDLTGLHSVTASNIGWTSSLPTFYEFNYANFSDTTGLALVHTIGVVGNAIYLTDTSAGYAANVYRSEAIRFDRSFSLEWAFECGGGGNPGADGYCVQWTTTNNTYGGQGGDVSMITDSSTINAFQFQTYTNNRINWYHSNTQQSSQNLSLNIRQNVYYWIDYNYATSTLYISYATTNTKPVSPQHTFNSVTFDSTNYYLGFGAATGGSVDNHILKSMKLSF